MGKDLVLLPRELQPQLDQLTLPKTLPLAASGAPEIQIPITAAGRGEAGRGALGATGLDSRSFSQVALQAQRQKWLPCSFCREKYNWVKSELAGEILGP